MARSDVLTEKGLPANILAEVSVLGAILLDGIAFSYAAEIIGPDDFHLDSHRRIFRGMQELSAAGRAIDFVTLGDLLERNGEIEAIGGHGYLISLTEGMPRSINIEHYARIVKDRAVQRRLHSAAEIISAECLSGMQESGAILDKAQQLIFDIADDQVKDGLSSIKAITGPLLTRIDELRGQDITGLKTGFTALDQITAGLQKSELAIVAARPSMGKTAFAMNLATNAALHSGKTVAVFSLEMSKVQLVMRMLCSQAQVDAHSLRMGYLGKDDMRQLTSAAGQLAEAPIFIDDTSGIDLMTLRAKCRRLKLERKALDLIVIDYLQLMGSTTRFENRNLEISAISRGLKGMAKEFQVPVVALSQLSRASEQRKGEHRPILSDLRESGSIEQDADVVMFIYRDEVYNRDSEDQGVAEIIIGKQRNGPIGTIRLAFLRQYTRFENLAAGRGEDG
jgi:replicative DNA helicase